MLQKFECDFGKLVWNQCGFVFILSIVVFSEKKGLIEIGAAAAVTFAASILLINKTCLREMDVLDRTLYMQIVTVILLLMFGVSTKTLTCDLTFASVQNIIMLSVATCVAAPIFFQLGIKTWAVLKPR